MSTLEDVLRLSKQLANWTKNFGFTNLEFLELKEKANEVLSAFDSYEYDVAINKLQAERTRIDDQIEKLKKNRAESNCGFRN